jgi:hypothetical protein
MYIDDVLITVTVHIGGRAININYSAPIPIEDKGNPAIIWIVSTLQEKAC